MAFGGNDEKNVKLALHRGGAETLNVYSASIAYLGWSTMPWRVSQGQEGLKKDGIILHYKTLPGGPMAAYNEGKTLVHEAGYLLGLNHTFLGGCGPKGDRVSDAPAEAEAA